jgi:hypothetical protein
MVTGTILCVAFVPVFYVVVARLGHLEDKKKAQ